MRFATFSMALLLITSMLCLGCEEDKPIRGSEDAKPASDIKTEMPQPEPGTPTQYTDLLKEKGIDRSKLPNVEIEVKGKGKIVVELVPQLAPNTCARILELVKQKFYDGQRFHRIEDWVVQWGDPQSKERNWEDLQVGTQGSGKIIDFDDNWIRQDRGVLAMARTQAQKNGDSQMYVLKRDTPQLTREYVAFGWVIEGMDLIDKLTRGDVITSMKVTRE